MKFTTITLDDCLDIRHPVLWPQLPREASRVEGDDDAQHFGVLHNGKPVSCLSVFMLDASVCQIRKFATLKMYQRQGFGRFLFQSVLEKMAEAGVHEVCLDARIGAVNFYTKFGFRPEGEHFFKKGVEYVRMARR
ncbi:TPA: GNAT family N-acetyltransferase [Kluyvera intermedia]|uniref:Acetyltransferase n=2 Tax=Enterobacteriaceae TaxID=543 RepID=A0AAC8QUV9_9ENTR|nr:GNAT family N-acetyltransferase [Phytobacter ursingii]HAT2206472.1 GNAT family N-acetyltransferase [Kluyvera intermedia]AKL15436.1 acetyltransferase [Phytobacter ursingii]HAT2517146.1 GNAT family N-acetyltransferase [Kluyvera intermedia]HAT2604971.1 GNAT family N-acetyltransferase [Kluyvera intermedia]HAT2681871.1 GNAT family N-acetyltransferase [Kluyvera intermedia]